MPYSQNDLAAARAAQTAAATSGAPQTRLVAGPGTGKSRTIEQRVGWLIQQQVQPDTVAVVSFTRASAQDLAARVRAYSEENNLPAMREVRVTTLHALALRVLRQAGLLQQYPVDPIVLGEWETKHILEAEFAILTDRLPSRCEDIRRYNEAYWQTGVFNPPNFIPPDPPITRQEQNSFQRFHGARTQLYSCVLLGEIIRQCVEQTRAGVLAPNDLIRLRHLIVDEYQDLNSLDQEFIEHFVGANVSVFISGDDDQSIYSFRFAAPEGIQNFLENHPGAVGHSLQHCFRYGATILNAGVALMGRFGVQGRIPKQFISMYANSQPPVPGQVYRWRFQSGVREAQHIARTCTRLIESGVEAGEIMILLSNSRVLARPIEDALAVAGVPFAGVGIDTFKDTDAGRIAMTLLRIVCNRDDYVALRVLLGELPNVGIGTCNRIAELAIANGLNYRSLFYQVLPNGVFGGRVLNALNRARAICGEFEGWLPNDTIGQRTADISDTLLNEFGRPFQVDWDQYVQDLPQDMTLQELKELLSAASDEQVADVLRGVYSRLQLEEPDDGFVESRVRVMTMHSAKGLSSKIVFIPGLEEEVFPGNWRRPYPGLVLEGARLFYVSITRARVACFLSYAIRRIVNGRHQNHTASRYNAHTGAAFGIAPVRLSAQESDAIFGASENL